MKKLAIIPARGGSKRIPHKNIQPFLGAPIISYSIKSAIDSKLFDYVMVSTDDEEIAATAKKYGAEVPFYRSEKNADDNASTEDVLYEVLEKLKAEKNMSFDTACCIYPTAALTSKENLIEAYKSFSTQDIDCLFPVMKFSFPVQRGLSVLNNQITILDKISYEKRSQDLEPVYHDTGQFYWFKAGNFMKNKVLFSDNRTGAIVYSELDAHDIDSPDDWKIAELKYQLKFKK